MDPRFEKAPLFDRRSEEWNLETIQENVEKLFKNIELLDNWKFKESEWNTSIKSTNNEELKRSILRVLKIKIENQSEKEEVFSIQFPELIDDQFFYIGGFYKTPIYQLFDLPVIFRKPPNKKYMFKLRTNTINISMDFAEDTDVLTAKLFNRNVPLHKLVALVHTKEELDEFYAALSITANDQEKEIPSRLWNLKKQVENEWKEYPTEDAMFSNIGEYFMNNVNEKHKKAASTKFSIRAAYEIDHFSREYFKTNAILFEILYALYDGPRSDTDIHNKRLRFSEYILSPLIYKVYEMMVTLFNNRKSKFKIAQNIVIDKCNKSEIIHFNFTQNPVAEIASYVQCTLTGPGGFKKENVPIHLRNMDDSHKGYICPADTPDREGCGVILNMVPTTEVNEDGRFVKKNDDLVTSYPISLTPFLQNDDQTRLQMASNQAKQTILIKDASHPMVKSGTEGMYLDKTTYLKRAVKDGRVIYKDGSYMVVLYSDGEHDAFEINHRPLYLDSLDYIKSNFDLEQEFKAGDVLAQSIFIKDEELALGQNLLSTVMIWKGFNYEDGIVISEEVTEKMTSVHYVDLTFEIEPGQVLLSLDNKDYKPLPEIGETLTEGQSYAKLKMFDAVDGYETIHEEPIEKIAPIDCKIIGIEIYPNSWNKKVNAFDNKITELMTRQNIRYNRLSDSLSALNKKETKDFVSLYGLRRLDCANRMEKYSTKGKTIGGVLIKLTAMYEEKIGIGDKVANRHGNKGVISKIIPKDQMPLLPDGRRAEIIINPLGIISRMNVGQLFELHMGEAIYQLKEKMKEFPDKKGMKLFKSVLKLADHSDNKWVTKKALEEFELHEEELGYDYAVEKISICFPAFQTIHPKELFAIMELVGAKTRYEIFDPEEDTKIENEVVSGYMYFLKLVHRSRDKMSSRSIGPYSKRTSQPLGGKKRRGGHRLGEMEVWAMLSHGANNFLRELLTTHSDSIGKKSKVLAEILQNPELSRDDEEQDDTPQSLKVLDSYLKQMGIQIEFDKDLEAEENVRRLLGE